MRAAHARACIVGEERCCRPFAPSSSSSSSRHIYVHNKRTENTTTTNVVSFITWCVCVCVRMYRLNVHTGLYGLGGRTTRRRRRRRRTDWHRGALAAGAVSVQHALRLCWFGCFFVLGAARTARMYSIWTYMLRLSASGGRTVVDGRTVHWRANMLTQHKYERTFNAPSMHTLTRIGTRFDTSYRVCKCVGIRTRYAPNTHRQPREELRAHGPDNRARAFFFRFDN